MGNLEQVEDSSVQTLGEPKLIMCALFAAINTTGVHAHDVDRKCNVQIFKSVMTLDDLRKKVLYQNTLDVWIGACEEKDINWNDAESYRKFIGFLLSQNLNMKKFPLCVSESDSEVESAQKKIKFAEILNEAKDPNSATYTVRLNNSTIDLIRKFELN